MKPHVGKNFRIGSRSRKFVPHADALLRENNLLREYYLAAEAILAVGLAFATDAQFARFNAAQTAVREAGAA